MRQALDGFFAAFDAKAREIAVLKPGGGLRLLSSDGKAIRVSKLDELGMTCYAPLAAAENPAGVPPASSIGSHDKDRFRSMDFQLFRSAGGSPFASSGS